MVMMKMARIMRRMRWGIAVCGVVSISVWGLVVAKSTIGREHLCEAGEVVVRDRCRGLWERVRLEG
jgi:hypothetical protein